MAAVATVASLLPLKSLAILARPDSRRRVEHLHGIDEGRALAGVFPRPRRLKGQWPFSSRRLKGQWPLMPVFAAFPAGDAPAVGAAVEEEMQ
jgi:hypothetical protein